MESQTPTPSESVPQRLHWFPAGLSLVCPGLGQLVQGRPVFLCHVITWVLVVVTWIPFFPVLWEVWATGWEASQKNFANGYGFVNATEIPLILFLLVLSVLPPLLLVLFVLFAVLDAAMWEREKPSPFHFTVLIALLIPLSVVYGLLTQAFPEARAAALRMVCSSHLKGLSLAFHTYHDVHGSFPPAYTVDENGKPLHSWRVLILPYIEHKELYDKIRLDEPWDSEYNRQFHDAQIGAYGMFQCPTQKQTPFSRIRNVFVKNPDLRRMANCGYSVVIGEGTLFPDTQTTVTFDDITDGTSNTILIVERMIPINWMDPNNEIRLDTARQGINRNLLGIGSEHHGGANVAFADGSVKFLDESTDIEPLLTKSAGD